MTAHPCRSCGADVLWAVTKNRKRIPIDAEPAINGNVQLHHSATGFLSATVLGGKDLAAAQLAGARLHVSHFVNCKQAKEWRRA